MGASSVTGVSGPGVSGKATTNQLSVFANGPSILLSGTVAAEDGALPTSPPTPGGTVVFPEPLPGRAATYVIILTTENGGSVYIASKTENSAQNFTGFTFIAEFECDVNYIVAKKGVRANPIQ